MIALYRVNLRLIRFAIRKLRRGLPTLVLCRSLWGTSVRKTDFYMQSQGLTDIKKEIVKIFGVQPLRTFAFGPSGTSMMQWVAPAASFFDKIDETDQ